MDELDEVTDKAHNGKANSDRLGDLNELFQGYKYDRLQNEGGRCRTLV